METLIAEERDRRAIEDVIKLYFAAFDRRRPELLDAVFAPDGEFWMGDHLVRGPGADPSAPPPGIAGAPGRPIAANHAMQQCLVELDGDTARAETYAVSYLVFEGDEKRMLVRGLRYLDKLVRLDEGWRILERRHNLDWMFEQTAAHVTPTSERMQLDDLR